jgi:ABC-type Fe3+-hydroxamate transport system substrate-binding protein
MRSAAKQAKLALVAVTATSVALAFSGAAQAQTTTPATVFPYTYTNPTKPVTTTIIPAPPKRIVVYGGTVQTLDVLATLGVKPIAYEDNQTSVIDGTNGNGQPLWVNGGELTGVPALPPGSPPDYEAIAALHPDLIISDGANAQFATIAPTIVVSTLASPGQFFDDQMEGELAPLFNETERGQEVVSRAHDLTTALSGFVKGTTVNLPEFPAGGQNFYNITSDQSLGGFFDAAGATIEPDTLAPPSAGFQIISTELLPGLTAEKVIANQFSTAMTFADVQALPLYPEIPAVKTGQFYFTGWFGEGEIGMVNTIINLQKQVFGVTGYQATLAGTGAKASDSGFVAVDVGPDNTGVCWHIDTPDSLGLAKPVIQSTKNSQTLLTLGSKYSPTGCASFKPATIAKLTKSPGSYRLSIQSTHTERIAKRVKIKGTNRKRTEHITKTVATVYEAGPLSPQSPAWFGNGKDTLYDMQTV